MYNVKCSWTPDGFNDKEKMFFAKSAQFSYSSFKAILFCLEFSLVSIFYWLNFFFDNLIHVYNVFFCSNTLLPPTPSNATCFPIKLFFISKSLYFILWLNLTGAIGLMYPLESGVLSEDSNFPCPESVSLPIVEH